MIEIAGGIVLGLLHFTLIMANLERIAAFVIIVAGLAVVAGTTEFLLKYVDHTELVYTAIGLFITTAIFILSHLVIEYVRYIPWLRALAINAAGLTMVVVAITWVVVVFINPVFLSDPVLAIIALGFPVGLLACALHTFKQGRRDI